MNHAREPVPLEQLEQRFTIGQIDFVEFEPVVILQDGEPRFLQGRIVVRVHVVEADDRYAPAAAAAARHESR